MRPRTMRTAWKWFGVRTLLPAFEPKGVRGRDASFSPSISPRSSERVVVLQGTERSKKRFKRPKPTHDGTSADAVHRNPTVSASHPVSLLRRVSWSEKERRERSGRSSRHRRPVPRRRNRTGPSSGGWIGSPTRNETRHLRSGETSPGCRLQQARTGGRAHTLRAIVIRTFHGRSSGESEALPSPSHQIIIR